MPTPTYNKAFKEFMEGVSDLSLEVNTPVLGPLQLGVGVNHNFMKLSWRQGRNVTDGATHFMTMYSNLSLVMPAAVEGFFYSAGMKGGYSYQLFRSNYCKEVRGLSEYPTYAAAYLAPHMGVHLKGNSRIAYCFLISYSFYLKAFRTDYLCIDNYTTVPESWKKSSAQSLNIGFGFSVAL